ncbi:hypothetical protein V8E36_008148 [Tilletia maclaganii]
MTYGYAHGYTPAVGVPPVQIYHNSHPPNPSAPPPSGPPQYPAGNHVAGPAHPLPPHPPNHGFPQAYASSPHIPFAAGPAVTGPSPLTYYGHHAYTSNHTHGGFTQPLPGPYTQEQHPFQTPHPSQYQLRYGQPDSSQGAPSQVQHHPPPAHAHQYGTHDSTPAGTQQPQLLHLDQVEPRLTPSAYKDTSAGPLLSPQRQDASTGIPPSSLSTATGAGRPSYQSPPARHPVPDPDAEAPASQGASAVPASFSPRSAAGATTSQPALIDPASAARAPTSTTQHASEPVEARAEKDEGPATPESIAKATADRSTASVSSAKVSVSDASKEVQAADQNLANCLAQPSSTPAAVVAVKSRLAKATARLALAESELQGLCAPPDVHVDKKKRAAWIADLIGGSTELFAADFGLTPAQARHSIGVESGSIERRSTSLPNLHAAWHAATKQAPINTSATSVAAHNRIVSEQWKAVLPLSLEGIQSPEDIAVALAENERRAPLYQALTAKMRSWQQQQQQNKDVPEQRARAAMSRTCHSLSTVIKAAGDLHGISIVAFVAHCSNGVAPAVLSQPQASFRFAQALERIAESDQIWTLDNVGTGFYRQVSTILPDSVVRPFDRAITHDHPIRFAQDLDLSKPTDETWRQVYTVLAHHLLRIADQAVLAICADSSTHNPGRIEAEQVWVLKSKKRTVLPYKNLFTLLADIGLLVTGWPKYAKSLLDKDASVQSVQDAAGVTVLTITAGSLITWNRWSRSDTRRLFEQLKSNPLSITVQPAIAPQPVTSEPRTATAASLPPNSALVHGIAPGPPESVNSSSASTSAGPAGPDDSASAVSVVPTSSHSPPTDTAPAVQATSSSIPSAQVPAGAGPLANEPSLLLPAQRGQKRKAPTPTAADDTFSESESDEPSASLAPVKKARTAPRKVRSPPSTATPEPSEEEGRAADAEARRRRAVRIASQVSASAAPECSDDSFFDISRR